MKGIILSGGTGTRLRPLTYTNAKQLIPLANKPILFHLIEKAVKAGINDIGIVVGDRHQEVKSAVGNGDRWNINISYIYQPLPLGLAHAVKTASDFLGESDFLMLLGDIMFNMDLDALIDSFYSNGSNTLVLLHRVEDPSQFGVAVVEDGRIVRLVEKPGEFISDLVITGVYVFDKSIFSAIDITRPSPRDELEITDAIQNQLNMGGKVTCLLTEGWWKDTGKPQDILEANRLVLDNIDSEFRTLPGDNSIYIGKLQTGKNVIVKNSIIMGPAVIDDDSVISNSYIGPYSSIGKGVRICNCELDNCIILENTRLNKIKKRISNSLIGRNVVIRGIGKRPYTASFFIGDNSEIKM